ncbi:arabinan endo-1,5-alpha-L-arabinosidase [Egibacter rhizosphaerae]|uniref:Arabinan endo-1,5-alpha-L-arabinosidase n=1 Tax=Egibacter rhizosphaerae TaxID=1670831 RepID=A0A411YAU3_9ACTN|nr:arabinan endo-1,5-alpha-L-arabinosidase [Egibacter rhizosphaerae]QBI18353.1 arabinan endo-1,5-alpha-L-arabinosidase [Egibacter rhizosphaerae]
MRHTTVDRPRNGRWNVLRIVLLGCLGVSVMGFTDSNPDGRAQGPPPQGNLEMEGDYGSSTPVDDPTHDPSIVKAPNEQSYYVFSTGVERSPEDPGGVFVRQSEGTLAGPWESMGEIDVPEWTLDYEHSHIWAPQVAREGNTYWLYYAASTWGSNTSGIGVMSTQTPGDLDSWVDHGPVITSDGDDQYNAIDPHVFRDEGTWYLVFGSYWDGIFLYELEDMTSVTGEPVNLAQQPGEGPDVEAPTIFERAGYYYLVTSRDVAVTDEYHITVGRSDDLAGPYIDSEGVPLLGGGGTVLLDGYDEQDGVGGQDVAFEFGRHYLVHHYYEWSPFNIRMQIRELQWEEGWPYIDREE